MHLCLSHHTPSAPARAPVIERDPVSAAPGALWYIYYSVMTTLCSYYFLSVNYLPTYIKHVCDIISPPLL